MASRSHLRDLDQHEPEADGGEIHQIRRHIHAGRRALRRARQKQWQSNAGRRQQHDDDHEYAQHSDGGHVESNDPLVAPTGGVEDITQAEHVEEKGCVVGRRGDVERVIFDGRGEPVAAGNRREASRRPNVAGSGRLRIASVMRPTRAYRGPAASTDRPTRASSRRRRGHWPPRPARARLRSDRQAATRPSASTWSTQASPGDRPRPADPRSTSETPRESHAA